MIDGNDRGVIGVAEGDVRPRVGQSSGRHGILVFAVVLMFAALLLFTVLEARRTRADAPAFRPRASEVAAIPSRAPDLYIPPVAASTVEAPSPAILPSNPNSLPLNAGSATVPSQTPAAVAAAPRSRVRENPAPVWIPPVASNPYVAPIPTTSYNPPAPPGPAFNSPATAMGADRVAAAPFQNPSTTVPKGTIIMAVLETALDSTRAGFARAIVSKDVYGFDGTRLLIPKGSRLVGDYKADLARGQKRALVQWQRLMRPDGAVIAIDSPSADTLGRAGITGRVDSHFLERFGDTFLQSVLSIGTQVAYGSVADSGVILALPAQTAAPAASGQYAPTVKVKQGTSVSVFVAKDLDFTAVDQ